MCPGAEAGGHRRVLPRAEELRHHLSDHGRPLLLLHPETQEDLGPSASECEWVDLVVSAYTYCKTLFCVNEHFHTDIYKLCAIVWELHGNLAAHKSFIYANQNATNLVLASLEFCTSILTRLLLSVLKCQLSKKKLPVKYNKINTMLG